MLSQFYKEFWTLSKTADCSDGLQTLDTQMHADKDMALKQLKYHNDLGFIQWSAGKNLHSYCHMVDTLSFVTLIKLVADNLTPWQQSIDSCGN